jgi:putative ABC transport system permease protein
MACNDAWPPSSEAVKPPPRLAVRLLTMRLSAEWREFVIGDLEEEFAARGAVSPGGARLWFWWQTVRCLIAQPPRSVATIPIRGDSAMQSLVADLRYALRVIARTPSFAIAVVAIFALGIGANTATFSIVNAVLLRPMPLEDPERLVSLFTRPPQTAGAPQRFVVSPGKFYDWQREARSFEAMAMHRGRQYTLTGTGSARAVLASQVGAGFFESVRARPALGRVFSADEDIAGNHRVVILSDRFWRNELGAAPDAVGRTLNLSSQPFTIVGVMPPGASVGSWQPMANEIWVPLALTDEQRAVRDNHNPSAVARLKPGVTVAQAQTEMDAISTRLVQTFPNTDTGWGAVVVPLHEEIVGNSRSMLILVLAAVSLVLLIACANVGNLLLARALARRKEIAIRAALGAGRRRVFQQLLVEALVLSVVGGLLGLALAYVSLGTVSTLVANQVPRAGEISIDARVLLFAVAASLITGCLAGSIPALRAGKSDLNDALKEGGRGTAAIGVGTRHALVVCEVALSVVLLAGAVVVVRNLTALRNADAGFNPTNVLTMNVFLPAARYPPAQRTQFFRSALERLRALPGVQSATLVDGVPLVGGSYQALIPEGYPATRGQENMSVQVRQVAPGYLQTMGIALRRGRDFAEGDGEVMLISESAATLYWGTDDPIGRRAALPFSPSVSRTIIGIVGEVKLLSLTSAPMPAAYVYSPTLPAAGTFALRTDVPPMSLAQAAVGVIHGLDPEQPVQNIRTMEEVRDRTLGAQRFTSLLLGLFAGLALLLASIGIYSVLSYIVRGRSREMGIRTALGAQAGDIVKLVIVEGMTPTLAGIAIGIVAAFGASRFLDRLVVGVSASDPLALALVAGALTVVALLASLVPAYRASRLDPLSALRE